MKGVLGSFDYFTKRLFQAKLPFDDSALGFTYSVSHPLMNSLLYFVDHLMFDFSQFFCNFSFMLVLHIQSLRGIDLQVKNELIVLIYV